MLTINLSIFLQHKLLPAFGPAFLYHFVACIVIISKHRFMILFAYAGNMDIDRFRETVPSAQRLSVAQLPGYRFAFNKMADDESAKANIMRSADAADCVWGVLIELDDHHKPNFFNPAGWSNDLTLEAVTCLDTDDNLYQAEALTALPHAVNVSLLPYDWYYQKIIKLAQIAGLPEDYIRKIAMMSYKIDPDESRRQKRLKKIGL